MVLAKIGLYFKWVLILVNQYLLYPAHDAQNLEVRRRGNDARSQFDPIWQSLSDAPARLTQSQIVGLAGEISAVSWMLTALTSSSPNKASIRPRPPDG